MNFAELFHDSRWPPSPLGRGGPEGTIGGLPQRRRRLPPRQFGQITYDRAVAHGPRLPKRSRPSSSASRPPQGEGSRSPSARHERADAGRAQRRQLLRQHHGPQGRGARGARRRDRHPDRRQWRGQVDPDDDDLRRPARPRGPHRLSRARHYGFAHPRDRAPADCPGAGRPAHLPAHDGAGEPADGRRDRQWRALRGGPGQGLQPFSGAVAAPRPARWHALRRRAADAGDRPRAHRPGPQLLLLDEPSLGLAPSSSSRSSRCWPSSTARA